MKRKQKGFTLIELLAVIVILAVIALIATPLIMNVINNAKTGADRDAAYGVVKAVETSAMQQMALDPTFKLPKECTITGNATSCDWTTEQSNNGQAGSMKVDYKGTKPSKAVIKFDDNGTATTGSYVGMGTGWFKMNDQLTFPGTPEKTEPTA